MWLFDRFEMIDCNIVINLFGTNEMLDECNNEDKVEATMYNYIVGSLMYSCNRRLEICYEVSIISKFMSDPEKPQPVATKRILMYLKGTMRLDLLFPGVVDEKKI